MQPGEDREYHVERARVELDAAYRAASGRAAAAHLRLSSMHMQRAGALAAPPAPEPVELELDWMHRCTPLHERCFG